MKLSLVAIDADGYARALPPNDFLRGAAAIATFLLDEPHPTNRRAVYYLFEKGRLPAFRLGGRLYARKSTLLAWVERLEAEADALARAREK